DDWRVTNKLALNLGLRYEIQTSPYEVNNRWANFNVTTGKLMLAGKDGNSRSVRNNDLNNFGPRVGIAYQIDSKTTLRTGAGISYTEQFDGGAELYTNLPYVVTRRNSLMAKVNTNQPFPGPGPRDPRRPLYSVDPYVGDLIYHGNWGGSKYHSLQASLQMRPHHGVSAGVAYTYSHNMTNTGENQGANTAQDTRNLNAEWGNSTFDRRNVLSINHLVQLPFGPGRSYLSHVALGRIVGGWDISGVWSMMSG